MVGVLAFWPTAVLMPGLGKIKSAYGRAAAGALLGGAISEATGGKFANGAISGAVQGAMMMRDPEYPDSPAADWEGDPELGVNEQCTGNQKVVSEATRRVNSLLRSGMLDGIAEFNQNWIDAERAENNNAFVVHWDPDRRYEYHRTGRSDWGHNDIWGRSGIYLHCAPSIRTAVRIIFHEIGHDYPTHRFEWFRSEGWNSSGSVQMFAPPRNKITIQSDVHNFIQSATNRAMRIYDQRYPN